LRICIYGAGAVGGHFAARLGAAGHDVSVVARGAQLDALRARGVTLLAGEERVSARVRASDRPADLGAQDWVLVTLKANALGALADGLAPLLGPDTAVVFCQNGIPWWYAQGLSAARPAPPDLARLDPGGLVARAAAPERVVGGVIYSANEVLEPGVIRNNTAGSNTLTIGEPDDRASGRVAALRATLEGAHIGSPPANDIRKVVWAKLTLNLGSSILCLLAEVTVSELMADDALAAVRARLSAEGRATAAAHGVTLEAAAPRPGPALAAPARHKPSMLQDYERGRPMEIEAQVLAPLAFARAAALAVPTLEALAPLAAHKAHARGLYQG